jgi:hypothetical protein
MTPNDTEPVGHTFFFGGGVVIFKTLPRVKRRQKIAQFGHLDSPGGMDLTG